MSWIQKAIATYMNEVHRFVSSNVLYIYINLYHIIDLQNSTFYEDPWHLGTHQHCTTKALFEPFHEVALQKPANMLCLAASLA